MPLWGAGVRVAHGSAERSEPLGARRGFSHGHCAQHSAQAPPTSRAAGLRPALSCRACTLSAFRIGSEARQWRAERAGARLRFSRLKSAAGGIWLYISRFLIWNFC